MTATTQSPVADKLRSLDACREACQWAEQYTDPQRAWDECKRGDWQLWILGKLSGPPGSDSRKAVVLCACECARLALPQYEARYPDDKRPRTAIETAEAHCRGEATLKDVRDADDAAHAAAYAAYAAYAAHAAAYAAAYAAHAAAYAAAHAAAYAAHAAAARTKRMAECSDIVRKHFPQAPEIPEAA